MIYKTLKKVSNYCQLLDKSKYPATTTKSGVTFTNNGDGSIILNGTCIKKDSILLVAYSAVKGHKYLLSGCPEGGGYNKFVIETSLGNDDGSGLITTFTLNQNYVNCYIKAFKDNVFSNLIFKPQLFDLTEMYGAGNEPTTVEQFRQDFPEELYDYKPYCFAKSYKTLLKVSDNKIITSYKKSLICTTKNLFDISKVKEDDKLKVIGNSIYSYKYPAVTEEASTLSIFKSLKPNTNYTISAFCPYYLGNATTWIVLALNNGSTIAVFYTDKSGFTQNTFSLTQEQINNITYVYFYGKPESSGGPVIWSNIQIELGDTATDYVPYGQL